MYSMLAADIHKYICIYNKQKFLNRTFKFKVI